MTTLRFLDARPKNITDGIHASHVRCDCMIRANLQVEVKYGEIVFAGCPCCRKEAVVEILPDGEIGFFPMGVVVL